MRRTAWLQETRRMRFEEAHEGWTQRRLGQEEEAWYASVIQWRRLLASLENHRETAGHGEKGLQGPAGPDVLPEDCGRPPGLVRTGIEIVSLILGIKGQEGIRHGPEKGSPSNAPALSRRLVQAQG